MTIVKMGGGGGMSLLVIDWDSIHAIGKKYDSKTQDILETKRRNLRGMNVTEASTEWDSAHFNVIKNHLNSFVSTDKRILDQTFQRLWWEWAVNEIQILISMQQLAIQTNIEQKTGDLEEKAKEGENS
jgi:hypothetical protein